VTADETLSLKGNEVAHGTVDGFEPEVIHHLADCRPGHAGTLTKEVEDL
jgi:hypothetical protein